MFSPRLLFLIFVVIGPLILSACQMPAPAAPAPQEDIEAITKTRIQDLLTQAQLAYQAGDLTYPEASSALFYYQQILELNPTFEPAQRGIEQIVEHFVSNAISALERRQFARSRSMLARAQLIDPQHPAIQPTAAQVALLSNANIKRIKFSGADLRSQGFRVAAQITDLVDSGSGNCRYIIAAPNDAQGRWVYDQIKNAQGDTRPIAQITIARPSHIEQICTD
tara:strand:+ start:1041 stop:1709 length:669 start_codon:yes stop_codon:yes gene_type:complete